MYGWKARLGITPTMDDMVLEPELNHMAPEGVAIYAARLRKPNNDTNASTQAAALDSLDDCVRTLIWTRPQVICIGSTSTSFVKGAEVGRKLIKRVEEISGGIPGTSISDGLLSAASVLDAKKVSVVTPYVEDLNLAEKKFLEDNGLEVTNVTGMQLISSDDICWLKPEQITEFALKHFDPSADALVLSCTGLHSAPIMDSLERSIGKPVISSNAAALWRMLRIAGVKEQVPGFGRLLAEF
jgi:maleate cis-trans isomerase